MRRWITHNWRSILLLVWVGVAAVLLGVADAVAQETTSSGMMYMKFLDSTTGSAVAPDNIIINDAEAAFEGAAGGLVGIRLPNGTHTMRVEAANFKPMTFSATVAGDDTPVMEIELDRLSEDEAVTVAEDAAVIEGYVTDSITGTLLENVVVALPDTGMTTTTAADGYYAFEVVTGTAQSAVRPALTLEARAEGYAAVRIKNVALAPGERRRMPIRLDEETTATLSDDVIEIDDAARDGHMRSSDWTFDVTVR